jgi:hypothetical protein
VFVCLFVSSKEMFELKKWNLIQNKNGSYVRLKIRYIY